VNPLRPVSLDDMVSNAADPFVYWWRGCCGAAEGSDHPPLSGGQGSRGRGGGVGSMDAASKGGRGGAV
jgi:hypothetical protein